jgi:Domain of unknown function (DUF6378)
MNKHLDRPQPGELLTLAFETINVRGNDYDNAADLAQNFREIAAVASIITGKALEARDIAMIQHCVKLVRTKSAPGKIDNYVDGVNYLAFAACFQGLVPLTTPDPPPKPARKTPLPPAVDAVKEPDYLR